MNNTDRLSTLLSKANDLPLSCGVYIMKDKNGKVIYVGKSKKLKNRVSQYFRMGQKNIKTQRMVSSVHDFDVIFVDSEIEALTLENTLIKKYSPRYNIKLKDAKSYPYIKIDLSEEYPRLRMTRQRSKDKAKYFGPYTSTSDAYNIIDTINKTLRLATCKRVFPRDIGKTRPCIYRQMNRCLAPCAGEISGEEYRVYVREAVDILQGNIGAAKNSLEKRMLAYAEEENYEAAAICRDSINSLLKIKERQKVVASPDSEFDIAALYDGEIVGCISLLRIRGGALVTKEDFLIGADRIVDNDTLTSFLVDYYSGKEYVPHEILLSSEISDDDREALGTLLSEVVKRKVEIRTPKKGEKAKLCNMALENARERSRLESVKETETGKTLASLASILSLECYPQRIEAYDISNIGAEHKTCGMIVVENGKFKKRDYRTFTIKTVEGTDDYASMTEAIDRRLAHLKDEDGSFSKMPDLILLDGGIGHVNVISELIRKNGYYIPVFGMVKDEHHKTRALCSAFGDVSISRTQDVFRFIYGIQEEVHRYSVKRMTDAKRKTLRTSSLENIKGIGPAKAKKLFECFDSIDSIRLAEVDDFVKKGFSLKDSEAIYEYFKGDKKS